MEDLCDEMELVEDSSILTGWENEGYSSAKAMSESYTKGEVMVNPAFVSESDIETSLGFDSVEEQYLEDSIFYLNGDQFNVVQCYREEGKALECKTAIVEESDHVGSQYYEYYDLVGKINSSLSSKFSPISLSISIEEVPYGVEKKNEAIGSSPDRVYGDVDQTIIDTNGRSYCLKGNEGWVWNNELVGWKVLIT